MQALVRYVSFGCLALCTLACGSKGDDDDGTNAGAAGATFGGSGGASGGSGGGTAGSGGVAITKTYGFDAGLEGWSVLFANAAEGITPLDKGEVTLEWSATEGETGGAIKATIPYNSKSQYVSFGVGLATPVDLTGKTLRARIKVVSGLGDFADAANPPGGSKIYAKSTPGYVYANGSYTNLAMLNSWITLTFNVARPDFIDEANLEGVWDTTSISEIGIQIDTGSTALAPAPAVVLIDTVTY